MVERLSEDASWDSELGSIGGGGGGVWQAVRRLALPPFASKLNVLCSSGLQYMILHPGWLS